ncbi:MAG: carboxypeptidase-like regulatory domain-containing protein [Planctomycetota bacterium]|jgi:hypothetical protein
MNARTGLTLVGLVLVVLTLGLVFGVFGSDPLEGDGVDAYTESYGNDQDDPDGGIMTADSTREDSRSNNGNNGNERREIEDTEEGNTPRPMLAVRGRVVDQTGGGVASAEVALYVRQDLESLMRNAMRGGMGRGRGRGMRGMGEDFRNLVQMKAAGKPLRTDGDGWFTLHGRGYEQTDMEVAVSHRRFAPAVVRRTWDVKEGKITLDPIALDPGTTIAGLVIGDDRAPIEGATVKFRVNSGRGGGRGGRGRGMGRGWDRSNTLQDLVPAAVTRADGSFRLTRLPAVAFQLDAEHKRYLPTSTPRIEMKPGDERPAEVITMKLGAELKGIVRNTMGEPIANADVIASATRRRSADRNRDPGGRDPGGNRGRGRDRGGDRGGDRGRGRGRGRDRGMEFMRRFGRSSRVEVKLKTNAKGEFFLQGLPTEGIRLRVTHKSYIDEERDPVPPDTRLVEIQMYPSLAITGRVLDRATGKPLELFGITARRVRDNPWGRGFGGRGNRGGGRDGGFGGRGNRGGGRGNRGGGRGGNNPDNEAQRQAEQAQRDAERQAREAQQLAHMRRYLGTSGAVPERTPKPSHHNGGQFRLENLDPGDYMLDVGAKDYIELAVGKLTLKKGEPPEPVVVQLEPGSRIEGQVVERASGKPLGQMQVRLFIPPLEQDTGQGGIGAEMRRLFGRGRNRGTELDRATTDSFGKFRLGARRPGRYRIVVSGGDGILDYQDDNLVIQKEHAAIVIKMDYGARIWGRVRNLEEGQRVRVVLSHESGSRETANVDLDTGEYEIDGLAAGGYHVAVEDRDGRGRGGMRGRAGQILARTSGAAYDLMLRAGQDIRYDLDANAGALGKVTGRVMMNSQPARGFEVSLQRVGNAAATGDEQRVNQFINRMTSRMLRDSADDLGNFEVTNVPAGTYVLEVRQRGGRGGGRGGRGGGRGGRGGGAALHREQIVLTKGGTIHRHLELFTSTLRVQIKVVGSDKPARRARVAIALASETAGKQPRDWRRLSSYRTIRLNNEGTGSTEVPPGSYSYSVIGGGVEPMSGQVFVAVGRETPLMLEVKPAPEGQRQQGQNNRNPRDANQRGGNRRGGNRDGGNRGGGNRGGGNRGGGNRGGGNRGGNGRQGR